MSVASQYEVSKGWFGRRSVKYGCPYCGERLRSPLSDAGSLDYCPTCQRGYTVPGRDALERVTGAQKAADEYAAKVKSEEQEAKRLRELEQATARTRALQDAEEARQERERLAEEVQQVKALASTAAQSNANSDHSSKSRRTWWITGSVTATVLAVFILYSAMRGADLRSKLNQCASNGVVTARVSYSGLFATDTVIFDLRDVSSAEARRIDPVHLLMQFADELNLYSIRRVVLARNGQHRFYISGADLKPLADSYAAGDGRIWAFNNLPAKVRRMDGTRAFEEWSGGWLGVLKEQSEDVNEFITAWTGYGENGYSTTPMGADSTVRSSVRETLKEMEDNVPETLKEMEDGLPEVMADMETRMMEDAEKYGLSPSEVRAQLREIEMGAREQIRGMEDDVRSQIRGMEDDVIDSLEADGL